VRIAIVGAGAIGCMLAARLSERGHEIALIGRSAQVEAINAEGLLLRDARGREVRYRDRLSAAMTLAERPELALLTVKTQDVTEACRAIQAHVAGIPVVAMQNGVQGDHLAAAVLGRDAVLGASAMCAATYLRPGEVSVEFPGWLGLGEPFGPFRPRTQRIAAVLGEALPTYMTRHLGRVRWSKLIANLNNALPAATGLSLSEIVSTPAGRALPLTLMREGYRITRSARIRLDHGLYGLTPRALRHGGISASLLALVQGTMTTALLATPETIGLQILTAAGRSRLNRLSFRGSTWQSIARGRPSEIEYLNGEIVRLAEHLGLAAPYNARALEVVRQVERSGVFHPVEDLLPPTLARTAGVAAEGEPP